MQSRIDYIIKAHKEYLDALAEFDRTGVLKIHGKVLIDKREKQQGFHKEIPPQTAVYEMLKY